MSSSSQTVEATATVGRNARCNGRLNEGIATSPAKQAIAGIVGITRQLGITVLGEGVETEAELLMPRGAGIRLIQGYYFAKPMPETFQTLGELRLQAA